MDPPLAAPPPLSEPTDSTPATPAPVQKRTLLSRLPVKGLKQIPRAAAAGPKRLARLRGAAQRRDALFKPLVEGDEPLGTLVVQVHAGKDLIAKDKNGLSDPYLVIRYGPSRVRPVPASRPVLPLYREADCPRELASYSLHVQTTTPTASKTLNPVWVAGGESGAVDGAAGEAKLEVKVYDSLAFGRERIEIVGWDRDRVGSEYLGEISLGLEDWWGPRRDWHDGVPPYGFYDDMNKVRRHSCRNSIHAMTDWLSNHSPSGTRSARAGRNQQSAAHFSFKSDLSRIRRPSTAESSPTSSVAGSRSPFAASPTMCAIGGAGVTMTNSAR